MKHLFGASREELEEEERVGRAYGRVSRVDHISFDIEEQERILRQHILGTNLIQKDRSNFIGGAFGATGGEGQEGEYGDEEENEMEENALQIGNIYKFNSNRNYYDSLESIEILRNQPPEYIEDGESGDDGQRRGARYGEEEDGEGSGELRVRGMGR